MKKWLIRCLTVLAMVCLIPGIVLKAAAETTTVRCKNCESVETREVLGYRIYDSNSHRVYVAECKNCHNDGNVSYLKVHTGGTETPTCTTGKTCEKCGAEYGEKDPNNHDLVHHDAKAPSCTEIGWDAYDTCSRCDYTTRKELPALNHDLRQSVITAPTCTETGWAYVKCSRCDYYDTPVLPALKHDLRQRVITAPTCTGEGWAHVACSRCDYFTSLVLSALNHDLEQHAAQAPTCMEKGWNAYETCSRCDYTTYVELPAQHDFVHHQAKAPTCTEIGWDAYETCSRCDYTTRKELPALNHDLVQHAAKAPTCTEIGWNAYEACSRCDHTTYTELPALNHDYQAVTVAPTCETDGYTVFTCSRCKDSYTADPTDQLGHKFGAWSPNGTGSQSADCLRDGCAHTGSTDCRKFTFRTAEGETLTFCPVCGQAENAAQLEMIEAATAWANSGSLSAEDVTARTNGEYLSVAFETAGSLTQPTGRVRLALPAGLLEGKKLVRIAPDGTQAELPFETERGTIILTLDFANSALPVMLFRLVPQTAAL
jgi:formate dehydrogenase maturation protein FdhE